MQTRHDKDLFDVDLDQMPIPRGRRAMIQASLGCHEQGGAAVLIISGHTPKDKGGGELHETILDFLDPSILNNGNYINTMYCNEYHMCIKLLGSALRLGMICGQLPAALRDHGTGQVEPRIDLLRADGHHPVGLATGVDPLSTAPAQRHRDGRTAGSNVAERFL